MSKHTFQIGTTMHAPHVVTLMIFDMEIMTEAELEQRLPDMVAAIKREHQFVQRIAATKRGEE